MNTLDLVVAEKSTCADGVMTVVLRSADGEQLPAWEPGAHVELLLPNGLNRQYSLSSDPADTNSWRLGILREPESRGGSEFVCEELAVGDRLSAHGPRNNFPMENARRYIFIAGGIGITPILPMIREAERVGAEWTLVYGGRTRASMAFLDELAAYGDRVEVLPQDEHGHLPLARLLDDVDDETLVYSCGPEPLLKALEEQAEARSIRNIRVERFRAAPVEEIAGDLPFEVRFELSELTATVQPGQSVIEVAEELGVPVMYSCSEGTCGTCQTRVIEGDVIHRDAYLTAEERSLGTEMMICVSRCAGSRLVLEL